MGGLSSYWRNKLLSHGFGKETYVPPSNQWIALSSTDPLGSGLGITEPSDGYSRLQTSPSDWTEVSAFEIHNAVVLTFGQATADWGPINYFALFDDSIAGNMLVYGSVAPIVVSIYNVARFDPDDLVIVH